MAENVGDIEYVIKADTAQLLRADKQVRDITDGMEGGFNRADKAASSLTSSFGSLSRVATSLMAILSVQQVAQYADAWTTLNNKLANALRPGEQLVDVTERVFNITQQTRGSLDATASLYARLEVISADKVGGGGGVVQHITFEINTTGGIDDATKAWIVKSMKQVALYQINDQANRPNGMIQPRTKR